MIVKFDHISFIGAREEKNEILRDKGMPVFKEEALTNLATKKKLMRWQQTDHDLYFFKGDYPVEYIFYNNVKKQDHEQIRLINNTIYGHYSGKKKAIEFLKGIFGNRVVEEDAIIKCNMKGILDKRDYNLVLEATEMPIEAYLDNSGYGVAAVIGNSELMKISNDGVCTKPGILKVNGKDLEIRFMSSRYTDIIFEIIRIIR